LDLSKVIRSDDASYPVYNYLCGFRVI
jgi:hypothetical protein